MSSAPIWDFSNKTFRHRATLISLWIAIFIALFLIRSILLPFILASLLAYVFHPIVAIMGKIRINKQPMHRAVAVLIIYVVFALCITIFCTVFLPQFYREIIRLTKDATIFINSIDDNLISSWGQTIEQFFRDYQLPLEIIAPDAPPNKLAPMPHRPSWLSIDLVTMSHDLINDIIIYLKSEARNIALSLRSLLTDLISFIFMILLVLMITGFILVDIKSIKNFVFTLVPVNNQNQFNSFLIRLDQRLSGVVRGQLTICLINAILTLIGLLIFNIKFAFLLATMAGIFSLVPVFGSIISTIPIVLVALTISPMKAFGALLWIISIHALEAYFLNPKILGDSAKIHPILIILSLLTGEHYYGITGALLAVPIIGIIITIFSSILGKAEALEEGVAKRVETDRIGP